MIEHIFIARQKGGKLAACDEVEIVAHKGIVGDRYFEQSEKPGLNVTFVEAEAIEQMSQLSGQSIGLDAARRNFVTRGVRLKGLLEKIFKIGAVEFYGVEIGRPCMASDYVVEGTTSVIHADWLDESCLRANVLSSGPLRAGMTIQSPTQSS